MAELDLGAVRAFVVVAGCRHFGEAAAELGITQQAVSKRIARLESDLGTALLTRLRSGTGLSHDGHVFLPHARALLDAADRATSALREDDRPLCVDVQDTRLAGAELVRRFYETVAGLDIDVVASGGLRDGAGQARSRDGGRGVRAGRAGRRRRGAGARLAGANGGAGQRGTPAGTAGSRSRWPSWPGRPRGCRATSAVASGPTSGTPRAPSSGCGSTPRGRTSAGSTMSRRSAPAPTGSVSSVSSAGCRRIPGWCGWRWSRPVRPTRGRCCGNGGTGTRHSPGWLPTCTRGSARTTRPTCGYPRWTGRPSETRTPLRIDRSSPSSAGVTVTG